MKEVSILYTEGKGKFEEGKINIPDIEPNQIRVKSNEIVMKLNLNYMLK